MIKKQFIWMPILVLYLVVGTLFNSAQGQPTATLPPSNSVFVGDTCSAPCWFDLTPGISTTADVEAMLERYADVFYISRAYDDENTVEDAPVINGWYRLFWQDYRGNRIQIDPTLIHMVDGTIYYIVAVSQANTRIADVLSIYGQPEYIWVRISYTCNLTLLYPNRSAVVTLITDLQYETPTRIIEEDYELREITYYSPQAAIELTQQSHNDILGTLLSPSATNIRQVPLDVWQAWMETGIAQPCSEPDWDTLSTDIEAPIYPTLTPTVDAVTTTPIASSSVFVGDTCFAPCWFDLIPGISTTADVEAMLERYADVFYISRAYDAETTIEDTPVINGWYSLFWQYYRGDYIQILPSGIRMQDGIVYYIDARSQGENGISEVLSIYGEPDYIWSMPEWDLHFIYSHEMMVISLQSDSRPSVETLDDNFSLYNVIYYSPRASVELSQPEPTDYIGYLLNPSDARSVRHVPYNVLICWLNETDCPLWDELSNDVEVPAFVTLTPSVTATVNPATATPMSSR